MKSYLKTIKALLTFEKGYTIFPRWEEIAFCTLFYCTILLFIYSIINIIC